METKEIWKNSKTFDGIVQVSNLGNIRRKVVAMDSKGNPFVYFEKERELCDTKYKKMVSYKGKTICAKRIIAEVFCKGLTKGHSVKFIDGDLNNLHPSNLLIEKMVFPLECRLKNRNYGSNNYLSKLKDSDILDIVELYKQKVNYKVIAEKYNIHPVNVHKIARNEIWKHVKREPAIRCPRKSK